MISGEEEAAVEERHFIELATRTLENDPATRDEARGELGARLAHAREPGHDRAVGAALYRLAKVVPLRWGIKGILASSLTILLLAALALFQLVSLLPEVRLLPLAMNDNPSRQRWFDQLPAAKREFFAAGKGEGLFILRMETELDILATLKRFRKEHPEDPAWYEAYSIKYISIHSEVPPGFQETWQRIDPGNGMWPCLEAAALTMVASGSSRTEEDWANALQQFEAGVSADRFETYQLELRRRKQAMLPVFPDTFVGNAARRNLSIPLQDDFDELTYRSRALFTLIYLKYQELQKGRDRQALKTLIGNWRQLSSELLRSSRNWKELNGAVYLVSFVEVLADCARDLGMAEGETELRKLRESISHETSSSPGMLYSGASLTLKSAADPRRLDSLARGEARYYPLPDEPAGSDAGRLAEYAAAERGLVTLVALLALLPLSLVSLESFRRGKRINGLADGLAPLISGRDRAWIAGLGCIAPLLWHWLITRFTPAGCRDIGAFYHQGIPPLAIQAAAGLLLSGVLTLQTVQWRIKRQLGFLRLGGQRPISGWIVAIITALIIPVAGCVRWMTGNQEAYSLGMASACGIPLLWLAWQAGAIAFSPQGGALGGVMLARFMAAPLAITCLILSGAVPLLKSIERKHMAVNTISRVDLSDGGITMGEARTVAEISKRIRTILETGEKSTR